MELSSNYPPSSLNLVEDLSPLPLVPYYTPTPSPTPHPTPTTLDCLVALLLGTTVDPWHAAPLVWGAPS